ncbi:hypothetical protein [Mucilaginibacter sp.]
MQKANHILTGILGGLIFPALAWLTGGGKWFTLHYLNRPGTPYIIAIAINLLLLRLCYKKGADQAGNGIILCTFVVMLAIFIIKLKR